MIRLPAIAAFYKTYHPTRKLLVGPQGTREDHKIKYGVAHFDELGKSHKNPARFKKSTDEMEFMQVRID